MDCMEGIKQLEDNSVDLIITSPLTIIIIIAGLKRREKIIGREPI